MNLQNSKETLKDLDSVFMTQPRVEIKKKQRN